MAMFVALASGAIVQAHIGPQIDLYPDQAIIVQADGHELEHIEQHIHGIPMHNGRVVTWYGDHAKFIAYNWNRIQK